MRTQLGLGTAALVIAGLSVIATTGTAAEAAPPTCEGRAATIVLTPEQTSTSGTEGDDVIVGSSKDDTISAGGGNDVVCALGGHDVVHGEDGNDVLHGGSGWDDVTGDDGDDRVFGEGGLDELAGGRGDDLVDGGDDNDRILALGTFDAMAVGEQDGDDVYRGGRGEDTLSFFRLRVPLRIDAAVPSVTGSGTDRISGFQRYQGGLEHDVFLGTSGPDYYDYLTGPLGDDDVRSYGGPDHVWARGDVSTGGGNDDVIASGGTVRLGDGDDACSCSGRVLGGGGRDVFRTSPDAVATIDGGAGSDVLHLLGVNDLEDSTYHVVVDVEAGTVRLVGQTGEPTFRFTGLHTVTTGRGNDILLGSSRRDVLDSGRGDDVLRGRGGNDRLVGNRDDDIAYGGPGRDACVTERAKGCESRR
jgi:Ca2+-binding RTX toxin-like protein